MAAQQGDAAPAPDGGELGGELEVDLDSAGPDVEPSRAPRRRGRVSVIGVVGELLITAGVLVLLFLGWQLWFNDIVVGNQLQNESLEQSQQWQQDYEPPGDDPTVSPDPTATPDPGETENPAPQDDPPVPAEPATAARFANVIVPRFGADFIRPIAQGVGTRDVLNKGNVGHYPSTQLPGAIGNFAVAGHRTTYGAPLNQLNELRLGDHLYVETADGWYSYAFRNLEYVRPTGVGVIDPVPQAPDAEAGERLMTLTSCNPKLSAAERIIAYAVFDGWYPRSGGAPAEIADTVQAGG